MAVLLHAAVALPFMGQTEYNLSRVSSLVLSSQTLRDLPAVRVGVSLQLDCCSSQSSRGRGMWGSWQLLVSYVNEVHGGIFVDGQQHQVELIAIGDYSDSAVTASNMQLLLAQGVRLFLGPFGSAQSAAAAAVVHSAPDAIIMATAASSTSVFAGRPRVFGVFSPGGSYFETVVEKFAVTKPNCAILTENFGPALSWGAGAKADIAQRGMKLLSEVTVPHFASEDELAAVVSGWGKIFEDAGSSPLILLATYEIQTCITLAREATRQQLPRLLMVFTNCVDKAEFASEPTNIRAYVAGVAPWSPMVGRSAAYDPWTNSSAAEYTETFATYTGNTPDYVDAAAYGGLAALLWALRTTGTSDAATLRAHLQDETHPTVYGELKYDSNRQNNLALRLIQYQWESDDAQAQGGSFVLTVVQGRTTVAETLLCRGGATPNYAAHRCEAAIWSLTGMLIVSMSIALVVLLFCILVSVRMQRGRKRARLLLYTKNDREVRLPSLLTPVHGYHVFLSHVWVSGQDQMRILKQRLLAMMPEVRVFLDVDDLRSGRGDEDIDRSNIVLVFISSGYFSSQNCMRELLRAFATGKPIITVCETSANKGALTREEVMASLRIADRRYTEVWGDSILAEEARTWLETPDELCPAGIALCKAIAGGQSVAGDLDAVLYGELGPIEWTRVDAFQNVTLRLIAERILIGGGTEATYIKSVRAHERKVAAQKLNVLLGPQHDFHLFYSPHNAGAFELVCEASSFFDWKLNGGDATAGDQWVTRDQIASQKTLNSAARPQPAPTVTRERAEMSAVGPAISQFPSPVEGVTPKPLARSNTQSLHRTARPWSRSGRQILRITADPKQLTQCRQMLVYLNALTWTSGELSTLLAADVKAALDAGVDLLLVHETPDVHGASGSKNGVDFGKFFACADGATPRELIQANIYRNMAVPLKDGAFRPASMMLLADNLTQREKMRNLRLTAQTRWRKWGLFLTYFGRSVPPGTFPAHKHRGLEIVATWSPRSSSRRTSGSHGIIDV